jgi:hypothetical protein
MVALCAARSVEKPSDIYLNDAQHHALGQKFLRDFRDEGLLKDARLIDAADERAAEAEESNNPNREWWDRTYGGSGA